MHSSARLRQNPFVNLKWGLIRASTKIQQIFPRVISAYRIPVLSLELADLPSDHLQPEMKGSVLSQQK